VKPVHVAAVALWTPGYATHEAWLDPRGARAGDDEATGPSVEEPEAALMDARIRRGTSLVTRMMVDVAGRVADAAAFDRSAAGSVFGSSLGEIQIALLQLDMMWGGDGIVSPARFKNSVHNTGSGVYSISSNNAGFTTAIAAGHETVPMTLLEAMIYLDREGSDVVVALGDEPVPGPLFERLPYEALAVGLALTTRTDGPLLATMGRIDRAERAARPRSDDPRWRNPCGPALALLEAIVRGRSGPVGLTFEGAHHWSTELTPRS
jgi:hypothetical protein